jgi:hypothetical protein
MDDQDGDVASEDSSLQVQDPSQEMGEDGEPLKPEGDADDPMR